MIILNQKLFVSTILFVVVCIIGADTSDVSCVASNGVDGTCKILKNCEALWKLFMNKPIPETDLKFLQESVCSVEDGKVFVCCPNDTEPEATFKSCTTPKRESGICQPLKACPSLYEININKPISDANVILLKRSMCFKTQTKVFVCCPASTSLTKPKDVTKKDPRRCINPHKDEGKCVKLTSCPAINNMLAKKPLHPNTRNYLKNSQCGFIEEIPYVCCVENDFEIEDFEEKNITEKLKQVLPEPPICGFAEGGKIFGGVYTSLTEYPWTVMLNYKKPGDESGLHCGGSLINEKYVVTAAHCIKKVPSEWNVYEVLIGEHDTEKRIDCDPEDENFCAPASYLVKVQEVIVHPEYFNYSKSQNNDIALIRLQDKVIFTDFVAPICLPHLETYLWDQSYEGSTFDVAGWGRTETMTRSNIKLKVTLPFVGSEECEDIYIAQGKRLRSTQICAGGEQGKDSCNGDSGGPLMAYNVENNISYWYLAGVVGYGPKECGTINIPGVYTRVSKYLKWISETVKP